MSQERQDVHTPGALRRARPEAPRSNAVPRRRHQRDAAPVPRRAQRHPARARAPAPPLFPFPRSRSRSFIPENTSVRVHFWSLHRDARHFSAPDAFVPERWLAAEGLEPPPPALAPFVHDARAFVPFSLGPWNCVGKNLALLELRCVTTHMMQRLDIRFREGWDPARWEGAMQDRFVIKTGGLPVVVERRF